MTLCTTSTFGGNLISKLGIDSSWMDFIIGLFAACVKHCIIQINTTTSKHNFTHTFLLVESQIEL